MRRHRHTLLIALALVALAPPALAQLPAAPAELPGFARKKTPDGRTWWHRRAEGWDYFAAPTPDSWYHPPLSIVASDQVVSRNFGLNLQAWQATQRAPGFSSGGGRNPDTRAAEPPAAPADDAEATDDPIALFCRRYHVPIGAVYAALGGGGGILGVLLALALRRLLNR